MVNWYQAPKIGSRLGPFLLRGVIQEGLTGVVFVAVNTVARRVVALKVLRSHDSQQPAVRRWWPGDIPAAARVQDPHLVPIYDWGELDGYFYVEMGLIRGPNLNRLLGRNRGLLTPERTVEIVSQAAAGLDVAHRAGLVHAGIRPSKILTPPHGPACMLNLGLETLRPLVTDDSAPQNALDFAYTAPERFTENGLTGHADTYSLACVAYECLAGVPPYSATSIESLVLGHLSEPVPYLFALAPHLGFAVGEVIKRGLAKNPEDRYSTTGEFAHALSQAIAPPGASHWDTVVMPYPSSATSRPNPELRQDS